MMSSDSNIKQFKLSNGDELVCEVVEWPEESHVEILIRNVIQIVTKEAYDEKEGLGRYYLFRPWMMYQEDRANLILLSNEEVAAVASPGYEVVEQYHVAVLRMQEIYDTRKLATLERESVAQDELFENLLQNMQTLRGKGNNSVGGKHGGNAPRDSSESNVLSLFPDPTEVH